MKPITPIIVLPTSTDAKVLREVKAAGYLPILCDTPDSVRVVVPQEVLSGNDIAMSALFGLLSPYGQQPDQFSKEIYRRMALRETK